LFLRSLVEKLIFLFHSFIFSIDRMESVSTTDITKMKYVVGYQLPAIRPTEYQVDITTAGDTVVVTNTYTISKGDVCGIPFCCLSPMCKKRKSVTDRFTLDGDRLVLSSTSAFGGLISGCEKGKIFQIIESGRYIILVNEKEIFIYSDSSQTLPNCIKYELIYKIKSCAMAPKKLDIVFLDE
jgi:hypothetical protein